MQIRSDQISSQPAQDVLSMFWERISSFVRSDFPRPYPEHTGNVIAVCLGNVRGKRIQNICCDKLRQNVAEAFPVYYKIRKLLYQY